MVYGVLPSTTTADIADSTLNANSDGVVAFSSNATALVTVTVRNSRAVQNLFHGVYATSGFGAAVTLSVSNNMISNNYANGIAATGLGSKVWASGNTISGNNYGLVNSGGLFESAGNNAVRNNISGDTFGTISVIATR